MLAYFSADRGCADALMRSVAERLAAEGLTLAGAVQVDAPSAEGDRPAMDLRLLEAGTAVRISQDLGPGADGCRLDPDGLERAVAMVAATLSKPLDLVVVNKFGKQEAEGRGFRPVIAEALSRGLPVLTAAAGENRAAFLVFADGLASELPPREEAILAWCRNASGRGAG